MRDKYSEKNCCSKIIAACVQIDSLIFLVSQFTHHCRTNDSFELYSCKSQCYSWYGLKGIIYRASVINVPTHMNEMAASQGQLSFQRAHQAATPFSVKRSTVKNITERFLKYSITKTLCKINEIKIDNFLFFLIEV